MSFDNPQGNDFFRRAVSRRWRWVLWFGILGVALGTATFVISPREYTSTANVFLSPLIGNPFSPTTPTSRTEQLAAMTTESGVVLTDDVIDSAIVAAQIPGATRESIRRNTGAVVPSNSQVMDVTFTHPDPEIAQRGAQAVTQSFMDFRTQRAQSVINSQSELLQSRESSVNTLLQAANKAYDVARSGNEAGASLIDLEQQVRLYAQELANVKVDRTTTETSSIDPGTIVGPASLPTDSIGIDPLMLAAAVFAGLLALGFVATLVVEHEDKRIWEADDLARHLAPPVLAVLADPRKEKGAARGAGHTGVIEQYLRITPVIASQISTPGSLSLVGNQSGDEIHSIGMGLGAAFAATGRRVCVVSTSRRPGELESVRGLSDVLADGVILRDVIKVEKFEQGHLTVMGCGTKPEQLPVLLQSEALHHLKDHLSSGYDLVIFVVHQTSSSVASAVSSATDKCILTAATGRDTVTAIIARANYLELRGSATSGVLLYSSSWVSASGSELSAEVSAKSQEMHGLGPQRAQR
ncbi:hypothetical protein [Paeniglutamicibacter gangotriensis]|nr:hypothetical protein [Paeniglutamicibacter gangotriensis]